MKNGKAAFMRKLIGRLVVDAKRHYLAITVGGILVTASSLYAGPVQLLSARNSSVALPAGGNGNSVAPAMTADGRFVVFSSSASDLVPGDNGQLCLDVFVRDRASNTTVLVSANCNGTGGGNGNSMFGSVSTNGQYVVFQSDAGDLVSGDTNGVSDIFVRDLVAGTTTLVSVATNGSFANGASTDPVMTPDGRYVAFISSASNLVANDTNGIPDVFVRDQVNGTTWLASVGAAPPSGSTYATVSSPVITPNGRYVAFFSSASGLTAGSPANSAGEIYVRDLVANVTIWASTNGAAIASNLLQLSGMPSYHPRISDDGRFVAFKTGTNNVDGTVVNPVVVLQYDSMAGTTAVVSTNGLPAWLQNDDLYGPEMSSDGRFIAFVATNKPAASFDVCLWDAQAGTNTLVSVCQDGTIPINSISHTPVLSPDGRYVAFLSNATNLVVNTVSNGFHVYLRDLQAGTTQLIDPDTNGVSLTGELGAVPSLSADGRFVAFDGPDGRLVASDNNNALDVFLRDTIGGTTELISQRSPAVVERSGNGLNLIAPLSLSADGRWLAFTSYASDLVTNDFNNNVNVFVCDLTTGSNILVSAGTNGNAGQGGGSYHPSISADGRYVVFVSWATNLVANNTNGSPDIFLRDLQAGTNMLVSANSSDGNRGSGNFSWPVISQDGRHVAFLCQTNSSVSFSTFWFDLNSGTTVLLATGSPAGQSPSISADGRYTACFTNDYNGYPRLLIWDSILATNIFAMNVSNITSAAISPTGGHLLYRSGNQLFIYDLAARTNLFSCSTSTPIRSSSQWSNDGRFVVFVTQTNFAPGASHGTNNVYLCDLQTGTLTLISANASGTGGANGPSDSAMMSGNGRFVAFRSFATDILAGITNSPGLFLFDRLTGSTSPLVTATPGSGWTAWVSQPTVSSNGATAVFQSWDSGLVAGDLNRTADVFSESVNAVSNTDSDSDGIPDWWMMKYFGHPTGQADDNSLAADDADGDGMSNLQEYLAGTDPTNPDSVFRVRISLAAMSGNNALLTWPAVPGKSYRVQYKNDLSDPTWLDMAGNAVVTGNQAGFATPAVSAMSYFRIVLVD